MRERDIGLVLNGAPVTRTVAVESLLRDFIRDDLALTGTKAACDDGMCGACTVHLDGAPVKSCLVLAVEADGHAVTTIEGMGRPGALHPVQAAMAEAFAIQCGFCTPGMVMTLAAFLADHPDPTTDEIREALVGNICRCTGYVRIVQAAGAAAEAMRASAAAEAMRAAAAGRAIRAAGRAGGRP
jgi:carbon-monoxide dehydrogenase small subunit